MRKGKQWNEKRNSHQTYLHKTIHTKIFMLKKIRTDVFLRGEYTTRSWLLHQSFLECNFTHLETVYIFPVTGAVTCLVLHRDAVVIVGRWWGTEVPARVLSRGTIRPRPAAGPPDQKYRRIFARLLNPLTKNNTWLNTLARSSFAKEQWNAFGSGVSSHLSSSNKKNLSYRTNSLKWCRQSREKQPNVGRSHQRFYPRNHSILVWDR